MTKQTPADAAEIDAQIDEYLAPLLEMHDDEAIRIARYLALKLSTLQAGIELIHAELAQLRACVDRIERNQTLN